VSIGDYVLSGGDVAALAVLDNNPQNRMSALGHKRTFLELCAMSALPPKADIAERDHHVRFVPIPSDGISLKP